MNHYFRIRQFFLACVVLLSAMSAQAQFSTPPRESIQNVNESFEKGFRIQPIAVFNNSRLCTVPTGGTTANKQRCENVALLCNSSSDTSNGACPTSAVWNKGISGASGAVTDIVLRFTEERSQATIDMTLHGYRKLGAGMQALNYVGGSGGNGSSAFYLEIPLTSLTKIPFGGVWKAALKTNAYMWEDRKNYSWDANITLKVADSRNMQIYLPQLTGNTPTVDLHLQARSGVGADATISGHAHIAACLYDGYNSNSTRFSMTASNPDGADFLVKSNGNPDTGSRNKISYAVLVSTPGSSEAGSLALQPGVAKDFFIPTSTPVQLVQLPDITGTVLCVPWGIDLNTEAFRQADKLAGAYSGKLNVTFSPSTNQLP